MSILTILQNNLNRVFEANDLDTIVYPTIATPPTPITTDDGTPIDDPTYEANLDNVGGDLTLNIFFDR